MERKQGNRRPQQKKWERNDWFWLAVLLAVGTVLLVRCFFAYACNDEAFYVNTPLRFVKGDRMLVDEWSPAQMFSVFLMPFVGLYYKAAGTEGILLFFRFFYIALQLSAAVWIYLRLRKSGRRSLGFWLSLLYLVQTSYGINAVSYNTLQITSFYLLVVILATEREYRFPVCLGIGSLWAVLVLCNPYMLLIPAVLFAAMLFRRGKGEGILNGRVFLKCAAVSAVWAVLFLVWFFSRASFSELLANLPYILGTKSYAGKSGKLRQLLSWGFRVLVMSWQLILPYLLLGICMLADRKRKRHLKGYLLLTWGLLILWDLFMLATQSRYAANYMQMSLALAGALFYLFLVLERPEKKKLPCPGLLWLYLLSLLFTVGIQFASNVGLPAYSAGFVCTAAVSLFLQERVWEQGNPEGKKKGAKAALAGLMAAAFLLLLYARVTAVFMEAAPLWECTQKLDRGPYKGLLVSEQKAQDYENLLRLLDEYPAGPEDRVLFVDAREGSGLYKFAAGPVTYLYTDAKIASYSNQFSLVDDADFGSYYDLHPSYFPTVLYCLAQEKPDTLRFLMECSRKEGYGMLRTQRGDVIVYQEKEGNN